jgi:hypothetical protein
LLRSLINNIKKIKKLKSKGIITNHKNTIKLQPLNFKWGCWRCGEVPLGRHPLPAIPW